MALFKVHAKPLIDVVASLSFLPRAGLSFKVLVLTNRDFKGETQG